MYDEMVKSLRAEAAKTGARAYHGAIINPNRGLLLKAADAIEELRLAQEQWIEQERNVLLKSIPRWIPVTERLPMTGEKAICFGKNGYMIGTYSEFGWMFPCYFGKVTHWMHLPEKPEEGE